MKRLIVTIIAICAVIGGRASIEEIRSMIDKGNYAEAAQVAKEEMEQDASMEGTLNALLGETLYLSGDLEEAVVALQKGAAKGVADSYRWLGRMAYDRYDFPSATANYAKYFDLKKKASKEVSAEAAEERARIALARRYFDRVEHIQVIDSVIVDREDFFRHYRLPISSGRLMDASGIPGGVGEDDVAKMVFATERGDFRMWAQLDTTGQQRLAQSVKLSNGTWDSPVMTDSIINIGNMDYPFLTSDGMTLYFAADGPESIGGLDIFMASRDPATDTYRLPQNIGMPYNSPWDDYMLAFDEVNNVGWWATDRNQLDNQVTIYIFIPNEMRENYADDTEDLVSLALLKSISDTWEDEADYTEILETIMAIEPAEDEKSTDFRFVFPDGKVYTSWDDFESDDARELMEAYIDTLDALAETREQLQELRKNYHNFPTEEMADEIGALEITEDAYYKNLRRQRSEIVRAEILSVTEE